MSDFMREDEVKANISYLQIFKRFWPYGKRIPLLFFATLVSISTLAISSRLLPTLIGYAIDEGVLKSNQALLFKVAIAFFICEIVKSFSQWSYIYFFQKFGNKILYYIREDLIWHIQSLSMEFFNKTPTGRIVTRTTNDVSNLGDLFTDGVINVATEFISLVSILIAMSLISFKLTLITMGLSPLFVWASFKLSDRVRKVLRESKKKLSAINSFVAENINGIKVIQLYNLLSRNQRRFAKLSGEYRGLNILSIKSYALLQPVMNMFSAVTLSLALYYGGVLSAENSLAIGSLVAFLMHVQDFIPPLREILEKYQQFQNSLTSAERVFQMFDERPEHQTNEVLSLAEKSKGEILFHNLNFRYEPELPLVLKNMSFRVESGESIAIVGRTGSGKSTLISLLQKFYDAPKESIFIDHLPIENIKRESLRNKLGVVLQDNFIFKGTIRENISLCSPFIDDEDVSRACQQVGYEELLVRGGRNLDSTVEERGSNLSAGERQLLAFARILAFQPDILILDEATANVDSHSENLIHIATKKVISGRTSLIVAHRLSTIKDCNRIVVLDQGQIVEIGTHEELLERRGTYFGLVNSHLGTFETDSAGEAARNF